MKCKVPFKVASRVGGIGWFPPVVVGGGVGGVELEGAVIVSNGVIPAAKALVREGAIVERAAVVWTDRYRRTVVRHRRLKVPLSRHRGFPSWIT